MHQKASDIMVWVFLSRMKCNLQTTSLAARKLRGSAARSRTGPPRTRGHLPRERRAGPGLYFFFFSPFWVRKTTFQFLTLRCRARGSPTGREQVRPAAEQTAARHSRRRRPGGDPPSPRRGRIRPRPPSPGWLLSPLPS